MLSFLRKIFLFFFFLVASYSLLAAPVSAQTREWSDLQKDSGFVQREYGCLYEKDGEVTDVATLRGIECIIANVLSIIITIIGLAGFVMMIYAAFRYQLGGSKGAEAARNIITYAVIGIVLALSSYFILNILAEFTGVSVITRFEIPEIQQS